MPKKNNNAIIKKVVGIGGGLALLALAILPIMGLFNSNSQTATNNDTPPGQQPPADPEKARQMAAGYEKVLQREPNNPTALQGLARAKLELQDYEGAREPLEKLYKRFPNDVQVMAILYGTRLQTNDIAGAKQMIEKLAKDYPQNPEFTKERDRLNKAIAEAMKARPTPPKK
jgi:cytochrome c-type biogenesis protein CcmH/NrfG